MPVISAGVLLYRRSGPSVEVLLVHPGGPFWAHRDAGVWTVPKGEVAEGEALIEAARREFLEETGFAVEGPVAPLGHIRLASGKMVHVFAAEGTLDAAAVRSNTFELEWPRGSGIRRTYPEVDRAAWFTPAEARLRLLPAQLPLMDRLLQLLGGGDELAGCPE